MARIQYSSLNAHPEIQTWSWLYYICFEVSALEKKQTKKWTKIYMKPAKIQIQMRRDYYEFN